MGRDRGILTYQTNDYSKKSPVCIWANIAGRVGVGDGGRAQRERSPADNLCVPGSNPAGNLFFCGGLGVVVEMGRP